MDIFSIAIGAVAVSLVFFKWPAAAVWVNQKIADLWDRINAPRTPPSDD